MSFSRRLLGRTKANNVAPNREKDTTNPPLLASRQKLDRRTSTPDLLVKPFVVPAENDVKGHIESSAIDHGEEDYAEVQYPLFRTEFTAVKDGLVEVGMSVHESIWRNPDDRRDCKTLYHLKPELPHDSHASLRRSSSKAGNARPAPKQLFVLLGDGLLLQYSESGARDRGPDRELQLTSQSVAFATDFIPGRPYVVHVAVTAEQVGNLVAPSRSWLARFNKPIIPPKAVNTGLFLILSGPEEMEAWLSALRNVIKQMGEAGSKHSHTKSCARDGCRKSYRSRSRGVSMRKDGDSTRESRQSCPDGQYLQLDLPDAISENFSRPRDSLGQSSSSSRRQSAWRQSTEQPDRHSVASTSAGSVNADHQSQLNHLRSSRASTAFTTDTMCTIDEPDTRDEDVDLSLASPVESVSKHSPSARARITSIEAIDLKFPLPPTLSPEKIEQGNLSVEPAGASPTLPPSPLKRSLSCASSAPDLRSIGKHPTKSTSRNFSQPVIPEDSELPEPPADNNVRADREPRRPRSHPVEQRRSNLDRISMLRDPTSMSRKAPQPLRLPIRVSSSPCLLQRAQSASLPGQTLSLSRTCQPNLGRRPSTLHDSREPPPYPIKSRTASASRLPRSPTSLAQVPESGDAAASRPASAAAAAAADRSLPSLKRPSNVAVRSNHAPFLSSIRTEGISRSSQSHSLRSPKSAVSVPPTMWERGIPDWAKAEQLVKPTSTSSEDLTKGRPASRTSSHTSRPQSQQLPSRRPSSRMSTLGSDSSHSLLGLGPATPPPTGPLPPPPPPKAPPPNIPLPRPPTAETQTGSVSSDWASAKSSQTSDGENVCNESPDSGQRLNV